MSIASADQRRGWPHPVGRESLTVAKRIHLIPGPRKNGRSNAETFEQGCHRWPPCVLRRDCELTPGKSRLGALRSAVPGLHGRIFLRRSPPEEFLTVDRQPSISLACRANAKHPNLHSRGSAKVLPARKHLFFVLSPLSAQMPREAASTLHIRS